MLKLFVFFIYLFIFLIYEYMQRVAIEFSTLFIDKSRTESNCFNRLEIVCSSNWLFYRYPRILLNSSQTLGL